VNFRQPTYLGYLAIIRIAIGYHFVLTGWQKISTGFGASQLSAQLMEGASRDMFAWHRDFIVGWVVPNASWFSQLVAYGEFAIGLSLLFGCLVRLGAGFGAFHNLNIYMSIAAGPQVGLNRLFVIAQLVFVAASAGRALGLDGWLHRRFPKSPLF